jgi:2-(3-amino-3-carboxypropyl)histidine synthase
MKLIYIPCSYKKELSAEFLSNLKANLLNFKKIGTFTTVQFLPQIRQLEAFLRKNKKTVHSGGQVLGCNPLGPLKIAAEVDAFVYLGSGKFHPIAVAMQTSKPIFVANPLTSEVAKLSEEERLLYLRVKEQRLKEAISAKIFGILVSTKPGQNNMKSAKEIAAKIEKRGKKAYIFVFETLIPESLLDFPQIEAWVNTACPRIAIDDFERFDMPVVNADELLDMVK